MQSSAGRSPAEGFLLGPVSDEAKKGMETLYAYLAGAIDIDGRISISRDRGYRRAGREMVYYYSAVIMLSDSDPVLPDLLQDTFPASRLQYEAKNRSHREWHMWEAVGQKAQEPLIHLLPYLRIRRRQAELALSLITLVHGCSSSACAQRGRSHIVQHGAPNLAPPP